MKTTNVAIGAALLVAVAASSAEAQRPVSPAYQYSLLGGTTVPAGADVVSGEFGWPSASFGFTHGMGPNTDVGFRFDLIYGFENTDISQFGIGFRVPLRLMAFRRDRLSALVHFDPGVKVYTTNPAAFGFQFPVGLNLGYSATPELNVGFGFDLPMTLFVTPSPATFFLGPLFGPAFEFHADRQLAIGLNTRFGPMFNTQAGASRFGFVTQLLLAYRM